MVRNAQTSKLGEGPDITVYVHKNMGCIEPDLLAAAERNEVDWSQVPQQLSCCLAFT